MARRNILQSGLLPLLVVLALGTAAFGCGTDTPAGQGNGGEGARPPPPPGGSGGNAGGSGGSGGTGEGGSGGEVEPPCRITSVDPRRGSTAGGERVTINGLNFKLRQNQKVYFGPADEPDTAVSPALSVNSIDGDTILATTPAGVDGFARVVVENDSGRCECLDCFKYAGPVRLDAVTPSEGYLYGGTTVTLSGENLRADMIVLFGGRRAFDVTESPEGCATSPSAPPCDLVVVTPPGDAEGAVDVVAFDADGHDTLRRSFTYRDRVIVDEVDPPGGPIAGGNQVAIRGRGFGSGVRVFFGVSEAVAVPGPDGSILATVPRGVAAGAVDVEVRTAAGSGVRSSAYAYWDPLDASFQLFAVTPPRGPLGGGNEAVLVGNALDSGLLVARFGSVQAPVSDVSSHFATVTVPPAVGAGAVDVSARVSSGAGSLPGAYVYEHPLQVDGVDPAIGPEDGNTAITITGARFPAAVKVYVGTFEATNVVRVSDAEITAVTPRGTDGAVPVRVVEDGNPDNEGVLANAFRFEGGFSFLALDPVSGSRAGGTRVQLFGSGFRPDLVASFGATPAAKMEIESPFIAWATSPRGEVGTVDVAVTEVLGTGVLEGSFSYFNPASTAGGSSGGALRGTLNVTVLDGGQARFGLPLPDSLVVVGTDDTTAIRCEKDGAFDVLNCLTDDRGQITFSDSSLVKAQVVTASHPGYEHTTVINQSAENLTVYLTPNEEPGQCEDGLDNDGDGGVDFFPPDAKPCRQSAECDEANGFICSPGLRRCVQDLTGPRDTPDGRADAGDPNCQCAPDLEPEGMEDFCLCPNPLGPKIEINQCCDGIDQDADGLIDIEDPDCQCTQGYSEFTTQCSDCKDNDGDGTQDAPPPPPGITPDIACTSSSVDDERGGVVTGQVFGFKAPRELAADETELAYVSFSVPSVYNLARGFARSSISSFVTISQDGGTYSFEFPGRQQIAMYAVYGIKKGNAFTPLLMGIARGVTTEPGKPVTANILLDTHLDMNVQVNLENSPARDLSTEVLAFLDLGTDGIILMRQGLTLPSAVVPPQTPDTVTVQYMPRLAGESFVFQVWAADPNGIPILTTFRRQPGDISSGVTIGPLMGAVRIVTPPENAPFFEGVVEWTTGEGGPEPEVAQVIVQQPTLGAPIPRWNIVVPGKERRVAMPATTMEELRKAVFQQPPFQATQLNVFVIAAREPRFDFDQWTYDNLSAVSWTSFTQDGKGTFLLP